MPETGELAFEDRLSRFLDELALAGADGSYSKLVQRLANVPMFDQHMLRAMPDW